MDSPDFEGLSLSQSCMLRGPHWGLVYVLKFVRSRGFGARFLQPFPKSLETAKYYSSTKMAIDSPFYGQSYPLMAVIGDTLVQTKGPNWDHVMYGYHEN